MSGQRQDLFRECKLNCGSATMLVCRQLPVRDVVQCGDLLADATLTADGSEPMRQ